MFRAERCLGYRRERDRDREEKQEERKEWERGMIGLEEKEVESLEGEERWKKSRCEERKKRRGKGRLCRFRWKEN